MRRLLSIAVLFSTLVTLPVTALAVSPRAGRGSDGPPCRPANPSRPAWCSPLTTAGDEESPTVESTDPFDGQTLFRRDYPNASSISEIYSQPMAEWFGDWNADVQGDVARLVTAAAAVGQLPVLVAYNIPNRDCGEWYSSGGAASAAAYHDWIVGLANGIDEQRAVVILEPDAVALDCFDDSRGAMLADAVNVLKANPQTAVYIDAGHPNWTPAETMADRLTKSGVLAADGFALNVSNFYTTDENTDFGHDLSARLDNAHFVVDTSRNANGWQGEWCNPLGAGLGANPTLETGDTLLDALLWVKPPGESDGTCNGGPDAGAWWQDYAERLVAQR